MFIDSINMLGLCIFSREVHTASILLVLDIYSMHQGHYNIERVNHLSKSSQTDVLLQFGNHEQDPFGNPTKANIDMTVRGLYYAVLRSQIYHL